MGALHNSSTAFAMSGVAQKQVAQKVGPVHMEFECAEAWGMSQEYPDKSHKRAFAEKVS